MRRMAFIPRSGASNSPDPLRDTARVFGRDAARLYQRLAQFYDHWYSKTAPTPDVANDSDEFAVRYRPPPPKRVYYREVTFKTAVRGTPAQLPPEELSE